MARGARRRAAVLAAARGPRYVARVPAPTTLQALAMGARAMVRSAWLVAPGLLVAFLRVALWWPAPLFAVGMARAGIAARLSAGAVAPGPVLSGALQALTAPRSLFILAGLWLLALLASAALRVAWLAGALPTLGDDLARAPAPSPRFAEGLAFGFAPLLGTALLGFALELAAQLYAATILLSAIVIVGHVHGVRAVLPALLGAAALTTAVAAPIAAGLAADAALARTALAGDGPVRALAEGVGRVLLRPGAFLLAAFALGIASLALLGSAQAMEAAALGFARGAPAVLVLGPRLMASALVAALASLLELWRLGTVAALACGERR
jgi:hypothetical protein